MQATVHTLGGDGADDARNHEPATRAGVARRLAALLGYAFGGEYGEHPVSAARVYFVPGDTVVGLEQAAAMGMRCERDLFGAVVPYAFLATKTITHPTLGAGSRAPDGWSSDLAARFGDAVLDGFSAFTPDDAVRAAKRLIERGPVRVKRAVGIGGRGQWVVRTHAEIPAVLDAIPREEIGAHGVVVEEHLDDAETYSVGQVRVAGIVASYWGTQRTTPNNAGVDVYGGSALNFVRGDFDALLAQRLDEAVRVAVEQARAYDAAAFGRHPSMFASRRNYDVASGVDASGRRRSGVLEQSWRIGGASPAEILALEAFAADPALLVVRAASVEVYGATDAPPASAVVFFRGIDPRVGALTKYATVEPHADAR